MSGELDSVLPNEGADRDGNYPYPITGSYHIFNKDEITFVIPVHKNHVKAIYVKRVLDLIENYQKEGQTE